MVNLSHTVSKRELDRYLEAFESFQKKARFRCPSWLDQTRRSAIQSFSSLGFPTTRDEHWKYTNVEPIAKAEFRFEFGRGEQLVTKQKIEAFGFGGQNWQRLVFVNGFYSSELSSASCSQNGLRLGNLEPLLASDSKLLEPYLARVAPYERHSFTALNTAFIQDGALVYLPEGKSLAEPIHLVFVSAPEAGNLISQPRILIVAGKGSRATVVESYVSGDDSSYFTNAVTEIIVGEGASIDHYKIQMESSKAFHVGTTQVRQERGSQFSSASIAFGARLSRHNLNVALNAENTQCFLNGLYVVAGEQHVDHQTLIDHPKPNGISRQLYKGIVAGKATAVFSGKIFVHPGAQKTDAEQTNKNLLLSKEATVDTKPQLEILADDVQCTHGAAVGQLDEGAIFYLKTRGIDRELAGKLLSYGFANEVIQKIKVEAIRAELSHVILNRLETIFNFPSSLASFTGQGGGDER